MKFQKYYLIFNLVYFLGVAAIQLAGYILTINMPSGASMGAVIAGCILSGRSFCVDNNRLPTRGEKWRLVFGSLIISLIVSIAFVGAVIAFMPDSLETLVGIMNELGNFLFIAIFAGVMLVYIGVMYFSFSTLLSNTMKKHLQNSKQS